MLVRRIACGGGGAGGAVQLVLLDHGLYKELGEDFRLSYCKLWQAALMAHRACRC